MVLATHCIRQFPFHFPTPTGVYQPRLYVGGGSTRSALEVAKWSASRPDRFTPLPGRKLTCRPFWTPCAVKCIAEYKIIFPLPRIRVPELPAPNPVATSTDPRPLLVFRRRNVKFCIVSCCFRYVCLCLRLSLPTFVFVYACLCLRLSLSTPVFAYVCFCLRLSLPTFVFSYVCLCLRLSFRASVFAYVCLCLSLSLSTSVFAYVCLCLGLSLPTSVFAYVCLCLRLSLPTSVFAYVCLCLRLSLSTSVFVYVCLCLRLSKYNIPRIIEMTFMIEP